MANSILYLNKRTEKYANTHKSDLLTSVLLNKTLLLLCLLGVRCIFSLMLVRLFCKYLERTLRRAAKLFKAWISINTGL